MRRGGTFIVSMAVIVVAGFAAARSMARYQPERDPLKYKWMIKNDLASSTQPTTAPYPVKATRRHPKRSDGTEKLRVIIGKHDRSGHAKGQFVALASRPVESLGAVDVTKDKTKYQPQPDIMIYSGWLYVKGNSPLVGTRAVVAQAQGCELILQHWTDDQATPPKSYVRVYYLEGDPDHFVWAYPQGDQVQNEKVCVLSVGCYVDAETKPDGTFKNWRNKNAGQEANVELINQNDNQYKDIVEEVDELREEDEV